MKNKWLKPTRPLDAPILCDFTVCAHGMGQAGNGRCPGDPSKPGRECGEFVTQEEYERQAALNAAYPEVIKKFDEIFGTEEKGC